MRFHRFVKTLTAVAVAVGVGLVVVASASADSGKIKFRGEADVFGVAPGSTTSTFDYKKDGSIKSVSIHTVGESVLAVNLQVECKPKNSSACDALNGSVLFDFHSSDEVLRDVEVVQNPFAPGLLDALSGKLSGDLEGALTVADFDAGLGGSIQMKIHGTATMGCFALPPLPPLVPIALCQLGLGALQPILFEVEDHGKFQIAGGTVGGVTITGGEGTVHADISGSAFPYPTFEGTVAISDATLFTE